MYKAFDRLAHWRPAWLIHFLEWRWCVFLARCKRGTCTLKSVRFDCTMNPIERACWRCGKAERWDKFAQAWLQTRGQIHL